MAGGICTAATAAGTLSTALTVVSVWQIEQVASLCACGWVAIGCMDELRPLAGPGADRHVDPAPAPQATHSWADECRCSITRWIACNDPLP